MIQGIQGVGVQAAGSQSIQGAGMNAATMGGCQGAGSASFQTNSFQATQGNSSQDVFRAALVGLLLGKSEEKKDDPLLALAILGMMQPMQMNFCQSSSMASMSYESAGAPAAAGAAAGASFSATA